MRIMDIMRNQCGPTILQRRRTSLGVKSQPPLARGIWGRSSQPPTDFYSFHIKKIVLSKKDILVLAVSTVTIRHIVSDNAKVF